MIINTAIIALATLFATIGPIEVSAIFSSFTVRHTSGKKIKIALKGVVLSGIILLVFAILGDVVLSSIGISMAAFRASGGVLLLLIGIEMVFARDSGASTTRTDETEEARHKEDIAVFPLATPLIAGPGAIGSVILLMSRSQGNIVDQMVVIISIILILVFTFIMLVISSNIIKILGVTGINVINRIMGLLLSGLAMQFVFDGIKDSQIFS
jgi:multiple antibiotic resistance protein